ncbi:peptidase M16, possible Zn-dependent, partial [Cupriavidus sp. HMR-1]
MRRLVTSFAASLVTGAACFILAGLSALPVPAFAARPSSVAPP